MSDKFISKWADSAIKVLVLFALIYVFVMFIHVESHHAEFSKGQETIIENNQLLLTLLTNHNNNIGEILQNQFFFLKRDIEISIKNQELIKENQKVTLTNQMIAKEVLKHLGITNIPSMK